eukprot:5745546-Pyramimonas_sp.AAC.1
MRQPSAPMLLDCLLYELGSSPTARVTCTSAYASDVSQSIPVVTSPAAPPTARAQSRKHTTPLRMTRTIRMVSRL